MNNVLGKLNILILIIVMAVLPLQSIFAGLPNCPETIETANHQHHGFSMSKVLSKTLAVNQNKVEDCCNKNHCISSHCASMAMMALNKIDNSSITYVVSNTASNFTKSFINFLNTSIYRPPIS